MSKTTECTIPKVTPNMNCELWMEMGCQSRSLLANKCMISVSDIDNQGGYAYVRQGVYGNFYIFSIFFCKTKTCLKKTLFFLNVLKTKVTIFKAHHILIIYISIVFVNWYCLNRGNQYMLPNSTCVGGEGVVWLSDLFSHL